MKPFSVLYCFLFGSNAKFNHDNYNYPRRVKTQFLHGTSLRTIQKLVRKTLKSPDGRKNQDRGKRALTKQFKHTIGEYVFFNYQGYIRRIPIKTLKLVYKPKRNGEDDVFITAYPLFWRPEVRTIFPNKTNVLVVIPMIIIIWTVLGIVVTMMTLHALYFCCLCLPKLAFLLLSGFAAVSSIIGCFHDFRYYLCYYFYRSCYRTPFNRYLTTKGHPLRLSEVFTGFLYAQVFVVSWLWRNESREIMMYILHFVFYLECHIVKGFISCYLNT